MNRRTLLRSLAGTTIGLPFFEEMAFAKSVQDSRNSRPRLQSFLRPRHPCSSPGRRLQRPHGPAHGAFRTNFLSCVVWTTFVRMKMESMPTLTVLPLPSLPQSPMGKPSPAVLRSIKSSASLIIPTDNPQARSPTLVAGTFFRRSRISRYVHSYNPDGTVAASMQERPIDLFARCLWPDQGYRFR